MSGAPGDPITASGSGWPAGETIQVVWDDDTVVGTGPVDSSGTFSFSFLVPNSPPGVHEVRVGSPTLGTGVSLPISFTVTPVPPDTGTTTPVPPDTGTTTGTPPLSQEGPSVSDPSAQLTQPTARTVCKIDVRTSPVTWRGFTYAEHLSIVFSRPNDPNYDEYAFQAGPQRQITRDNLSNGLLENKGTDAEEAKYQDNSGDNSDLEDNPASDEYEIVPEELGTSKTVLTEQSDQACLKHYTCLHETKDKVFDKRPKIVYTVLENSNAFVFTLLKTCGLKTEKPADPPGLLITSPGWLVNLLDPPGLLIN